MQIEISRSEGELLVELLEECDPAKYGMQRHWLAGEIRQLFGMVTLEEEIKRRNESNEKGIG